MCEITKKINTKIKIKIIKAKDIAQDTLNVLLAIKQPMLKMAKTSKKQAS